LAKAISLPPKFFGRNDLKTKKVAGIDLLPEAFAFCGDVEDPSTWKLPLYFRGNESLTRNHIKNALFRFTETKEIPDAERADVWRMIVGAAKSHGIAAGTQPAPACPGPARPNTAKPLDDLDAELKEARAVGELAAERFLKQIGY